MARQRSKFAANVMYYMFSVLLGLAMAVNYRNRKRFQINYIIF